MANVVRRLSLGMGVLGLTVSTGCMGGERLRNAYDPCGMERYDAHARASTMSAFGAQVANGHILDQTLWNYHFDADSDRLNASGLDKLDQLLRRRPQPDGQLFLATAVDVPYQADTPNALADKQRDLDARRIASIKRYAAARTASRPMTFEVTVHDPAEVGISGIFAEKAITTNNAGSANVSGNGSGGAPTQGNQNGSNQNGGNGNTNNGNQTGNGTGGAILVPR